jgi:hypothetical protein
MSTLALLLAAALAGLPPYPGARALPFAGGTLLSTPDSPATVAKRYAEVLRKAGWVPSEADSVLNGDVPGASPEQNAAAKRAGTLLSFERGRGTADILISTGTDSRRRPVTYLMIILGKQGGPRGRSAR